VLIGRFFAGHNKRHDVAIRAMKELVGRGLDVHLHLVGSISHRLLQSDRFEQLRREATGLPITFHTNAPRSLIEELISKAFLYWHAAGFEIDPDEHPEKCEHFGISILEAMSGGCAPLVCQNGGPMEFIQEGKNGFFYTTVRELADKSERLLRDPALFRTLSEQAHKQAMDFSDAVFASRWEGLVG